MELESLLNWSRAQFALTAMYHWLFVPLTLGLGVIMSLVETKYYKTNDEFWKKSAKFWQKLFGINFAIGVATGIILEFEFGTNWSNYSWFVGDIFGAPLAIEGVLAFFMEATFIAVMFFGWDKVSKRFHLASTWLTIIGATISAVWILVANAWMQQPVGMEFNPSTMRNEMADFFAVALSETAIIKFWHTVISSWMVGAVFALGVCCFYLLRKKNVDFALRNIRIIAPFGLIAGVLTALTGDQSAYVVAKHQPMKLAAIEALYDTGTCDHVGKTECGKGIGLSVIGIPNPNKTIYNNEDPYLFNIEIPYLLSFMGTRSLDGYLPGIKNVIEGGYIDAFGNKTISAKEKIQKGKEAISSLEKFRNAEKAKDTEVAKLAKEELNKNVKYLGYGYLDKEDELIPNVQLLYYSFRIMVGLGVLFILLFAIATWYSFKNADKLKTNKSLQLIAIWSVPFVWIASQAGWIVAELGRQPWAIQDLLPLKAAVSKLDASSVIITFFLFVTLFTALLIAELNIMKKSIQAGPGAEEK